jgi:hypothetical protein
MMVKNKVVYLGNQTQTVDEIAQLQLEIDEKQKAIDAKRKEQAEAAERKKEAEKKRMEGLVVERAEQVEKIESLKIKMNAYKVKEDIDGVFSEIERARLRIAEIDAEIPAPEPETEMPEPVERQNFFERLLSKTGTFAWALVALLLVGGLAFWQVNEIGDTIAAINKAAQDSGNLAGMVPPSISEMSWQKFWYSVFLAAYTFCSALLIMAVLFPAQLFYLLPFTENAKIGKWKEFLNQEESQKQWQSLGCFLLILFVLLMCQPK